MESTACEYNSINRGFENFRTEPNLHLFKGLGENGGQNRLPLGRCVLVQLSNKKQGTFKL